MALHVVNFYDPRIRNEGCRFGTVRYNPRATRREDRPYDVWLPELAPSAKLLRIFKDKRRAMPWDVFERRYRSEMDKPTPRHLITMFAVLSQDTDLSVSCYCGDESRCHRFDPARAAGRSRCADGAASLNAPTSDRCASAAGPLYVGRPGCASGHPSPGGSVLQEVTSRCCRCWISCMW